MQQCCVCFRSLADSLFLRIICTFTGLFKAQKDNNENCVSKLHHQRK